ncbi:MAG: MBL fold metallo-hydrolase [Clostridiales bacterium]|nr:MBL fold metallo-hydrolase [Clostridiales bacterium]
MGQTAALKVETMVLGPIGTNCYFLVNEDTKEVLLIDPASSPERIGEKLKENQWKLAAILLTHGHFDHIGAVDQLKEQFQIPVYACRLEQELVEDPSINASDMILASITAHPDQWVNDLDVLKLIGTTIQVLSTPGHTVGSVCYYLPEQDILFSGDTLFAESVGRTDMPTGSAKQLLSSLREKLSPLPDHTKVYTGHGEDTTIGYEKKYNPYMGEI